MKSKISYQVSVLILLIVPITLIGWKSYANPLDWKKMLPEKVYKVSFQFKLGAAKAPFVKSYLPKSNRHQKITKENWQANDADFKLIKNENGRRGIWRLPDQDTLSEILYQFEYIGKALDFEIGEELRTDPVVLQKHEAYLDSTQWIQSYHPEINRLLKVLTYEEGNLKSTISAIFKYVHNIPSITTSELTDALTTLRQQAASCNGKSRLFVALCRSAGIPARTVGGIILEQSEKKTSHLWTEVYVAGEWVPFDPLNGHFAYLPAHYMQLYWGDHFLVTRKPNMFFDYLYKIEKTSQLPLQPSKAGTLWILPNQMELSPGFLRTILVLPLCALMVGLLRNVVGLKTYGVFLPAIMAVSLIDLGFFYGAASFLGVVFVVSLLNYPLEKWSLLYAPKLVIILTAVVLVLLGIAVIGLELQKQQLAMLILFPIIIMTILAERFAKSIMEEGYQDSLKLMIQTLLVCFLCFQVFRTDFLLAFLITYPEVYGFIIAILLLLGRWIGLRFTEYRRFRWIVD